MKNEQYDQTCIRIAVIDSDPLRLVGFRALLGSEPNFELIFVSLAEITNCQNIDLVLLGNHRGKNVFDIISGLRARGCELRIVVAGCDMNDEVMLKALASGAKGCVDEASSAGELARAIRIVHQGSVWAPRRVLSLFIERTSGFGGRGLPASRHFFTTREKEVLEMLVAGRSNKEIGFPLGIEERTVKAHVAKLMRKVGVQNRIALSIHAVTHSLVSSA